MIGRERCPVPTCVCSSASLSSRSQFQFQNSWSGCLESGPFACRENSARSRNVLTIEFPLQWEQHPTANASSIRIFRVTARSAEAAP